MTGNSTENAIGFFQHGYVEMAVNNFGAHIELDNTIELKETVAFTGHLSGKRLYFPGFQVSWQDFPITKSDNEIADPSDCFGRTVL